MSDSPRTVSVRRILPALCLSTAGLRALATQPTQEPTPSWLIGGLFGAGPGEATGSRAVVLPAELARLDGCWARPDVEALFTSQCALLSDEGRARIAFALTNCQLESVGLPPIPCAASAPQDPTMASGAASSTSTDSNAATESFSECRRRIGANAQAYSTFTTFFSQVDSLCYFRRRDLFNAATQRSVSALSSASAAAAAALQGVESGLASVSGAVARGHGELAASLSALTAEQTARHGELAAAVASASSGVAALAAGQREVAAGVEAALAAGRALQEQGREVERQQRAAAEQLGGITGGLGELRKESQAAFEHARGQVARLGAESESAMKGMVTSQVRWTGIIKSDVRIT